MLEYLGNLRPPVIHRDIKVIICRFMTLGCLVLMLFPDHDNLLVRRCLRDFEHISPR